LLAKGGQNNYFVLWILLLYLVAAAIIYGFLIKRLHQQVHTDLLTGLCNRRSFYEKLSAGTASFPVSLVFLDIDNFKHINDVYGHLTGDQVLQQFAAILQQNTRKIDSISRWGGEEFALILPNTSAKEAFIIAERIRDKVESHVFTNDSIKCKITVSAGIASTNQSAEVANEQLIRVADAALLKAKKQKNTIVAAADIL
jgi:diguanylate cyclase (GGDEF)-like protein